ncbi:hypothetical protein KOR34_00580 [Posidoniimonas corsicana]|uniref:DUF1580 domain-containing protein n=1 Tax=Posidoniimonas corsicana TaxID=1938618 RepID=A0A5C5VAY7_9BACT|nr:DUF1580 domain-containing protein [Posidoniimonas corsicana]TWT35170.1 hypothetical protein KOR34_00580 [Posidoniimonas corsicana]
MIDATTETLLTIRQARDVFPNSPSEATLWRWLLKGVRGHVLDSVRVGGRRFTSREACQRFIEATSAEPERPKPPTLHERRRSLQQAQATLDHYGV